MHSTRFHARRSLQRFRPWLLAGLVGVLSLAVRTPSADAGCGCAKPPPGPAQVRPQVTYAGTPITLFSNAFVAGQSYEVTFTAMNGATATASGIVGTRRDLNDGQAKKQLTVTLPVLPLGPAAIAVTAVGATLPVLTLADSAFTVAPDPIALPLTYGAWNYAGHQAAVDRDGTVYLSLDLTGMTAPLVFEAEFAGYPLRFAAKDIVFLNTQGFIMQLLTQPGNKATALPIPGMDVRASTAPTTKSDTLHYSRHEFNTYFLQHGEREAHAVDPADASWHQDGTRHVDHDHLIVAILGRKNDGTLPAAGATPLFDLKVRSYSLFYQGLVGDAAITMKGSSMTESFEPTTGLLGTDGDVRTDGKLTMSSTATVRGDATAASFALGSSNLITGYRVVVGDPNGVASSGTVSRRVAASSDDVEEEGPESVQNGPGAMYFNSGDLELVSDLESPAAGTQKIGLRFRELTIPAGAIITSATVTFRAISPDAPMTNSGATNLTIRAEAADNAPAFTSTSWNLSNRPMTDAATSWVPGAWTASTDVTSPDLAAVVQEVVSRGGWTSGNSLAFVLSGTGSRSAASYDSDAARAPLLTVTYVDPMAPSPAEPMSFMEVQVPSGLTDLGTISLSGGSRTIVGPGSFKLSKLSLSSNARLYIDNTAGPVTFYVNGAVTVGGGGAITVTDPNPEKFAIYVPEVSGNTVSVTGNGSAFYGVIYAPTSSLTVKGSGVFSGAFVAKTLATDNTARIRYDRSLRGQ